MILTNIKDYEVGDPDFQAVIDMFGSPSLPDELVPHFRRCNSLDDDIFFAQEKLEEAILHAGETGYGAAVPVETALDALCDLEDAYAASMALAALEAYKYVLAHKE